MKFPSIPQLILLTNNSQKLVSDIVDEKYFVFFLLSHTKSYFDDLNINFSLAEPLLDPTIEIEQYSTLKLNDFEIGEISLIYNSVFDDLSLVYSSHSGFLQTNVMNDDVFENFSINDYLILLHEFSALLLSEYNLYSNFQKK